MTCHGVQGVASPSSEVALLSSRSGSALGPGPRAQRDGQRTGTTAPSPVPCPAAVADLLEGLRDAPWASRGDTKSHSLQAWDGQAQWVCGASPPRLEARCFLSAKCQLSTCTESREGGPCSTGGGEQVPPGGTSQVGQRRDKTEAGSGPHDQQWALGRTSRLGTGEGSDTGVRGCGTSFSGERQTPRSRGSP